MSRSIVTESPASIDWSALSPELDRKLREWVRKDKRMFFPHRGSRATWDWEQKARLTILRKKLTDMPHNYLRAVVRNMFISWWRTLSRRPAIVGEEALAEVPTAADADGPLVEARYARFKELLAEFEAGEGIGSDTSPHSRAEILAVYRLRLEGLTHREIAVRLGICASTAHKRQMFLQKKIKLVLEEMSS